MQERVGVGVGGGEDPWLEINQDKLSLRHPNILLLGLYIEEIKVNRIGALVNRMCVLTREIHRKLVSPQ